MRRALTLGSVTGAALLTAGVAVATLGFSGTQTVSATFGATRDRGDVRTCTGTDGTYEIVRGRYAGEADSSIAGLDGPLTLTVTSVYNATEKAGWMTANVKIRRSGSDDRDFVGKLTGTLTGGSGDTRTLDGFLSGRIGGRYADVVGNVTASFTPTGGFTGGKLGEGGANTALMIGRTCVKPGSSSVQLVVKGDIESLSGSSISVKPRDGSSTQACLVKEGTSPSTSRFETGDDVEMRCALVAGEMTLVKLTRRGR
jgi:hypothetical protein